MNKIIDPVNALNPVIKTSKDGYYSVETDAEYKRFLFFKIKSKRYYKTVRIPKGTIIGLDL